MSDQTESKLYSPERCVQRFINRYRKGEVCDRIEFKLYSPFNKGEGWVQGHLDDYLGGKYDPDYFYSRLALGYDVNLAILINGIDIVDIVLDKAEWEVAAPNTAYRDEPRSCNNHLADWQLDFKPSIKDWAYPDRRSSTRPRLRSGLLGYMLNIDILEDEDEEFVYWDLKDKNSRPITEKEGKKPICFKFAKGQFYEALDHFPQLIGKDIDKSQLTKPLLIERLKTQLCKLKEVKEKEERILAEKRADGKIGLEIEEKLKEAEENGTDVIGAFELGKLYYQYLDHDNALLWFKKAAAMGSAADCSDSGDGKQNKCDRIKFKLFYSYDKEYYDYYDSIEVPDEDTLRWNGRPHDIATEIYINGREILDILPRKWGYEYFDEYAHREPCKLLDSLINKHGLMATCIYEINMPFWADGGIVRNILRPYFMYTEDCFYDNHYLMVSEKEDDKFIYWRILNPSELPDDVDIWHDAAEEKRIVHPIADTSGKKDLFFKFAKEQYYTELAKLATWCDNPELNRTMWLERLADILVTLHTERIEKLEEEEDWAIAAETDGNKAYARGRIYYDHKYNEHENYLYDYKEFEFSFYFISTLTYYKEYVLRALKWFYQAAYLGNTDAMLCIGVCYLFGYKVETGEFLDTVRDVKRGMAWLKRALKLGRRRLLPEHLPLNIRNKKYWDELIRDVDVRYKFAKKILQAMNPFVEVKERK